MRVFYAETCDCKTGVMAPFCTKIFWFEDEKKAVKLHLKLSGKLMRGFYSLGNEDRYWAIHVNGRHLLHVACT